MSRCASCETRTPSVLYIFLSNDFPNESLLFISYLRYQTIVFPPTEQKLMYGEPLSFCLDDFQTVSCALALKLDSKRLMTK